MKLRWGVLWVVAACGSDNNNHFTAPDMGAIINESLPPSLRPGGSTPQARLVPATDPNEILAGLAAKYIKNLFENHYPNDKPPAGMMSPSPGYLDAQISHITSRL